MLLTLKPTQQPGYGNSHAYSPAQRSPSSYYNSPPQSASLPAIPETLGPPSMSTPHRGLPPPSAMERMIPNNIERGPPSSNLPLGALPAAPAQWQGQDESMRSWLHAKSEEDRRKQEEEKTRQEGLRLDQRKIEQKMLTDALQGQIPPSYGSYDFCRPWWRQLGEYEHRMGTALYGTDQSSAPSPSSATATATADPTASGAVTDHAASSSSAAIARTAP